MGVGRLEIRGLHRGGGTQESRGRYDYFRGQATKGPEQMIGCSVFNSICFIFLAENIANLWDLLLQTMHPKKLFKVMSLRGHMLFMEY